MINYILEVSCCWLGFYLVYVHWLSKETFFNANRWYLLVSLLLGLCLPFAEMPIHTTYQSDLFFYFETVTIGVQQVENQIATVVAHPVSTSISVQTILIWIYAIGVLFMVIRFGFGLRQIFQHYRYSKKYKKEGYTLLLSKEAHLPFSFFSFLFLSASAKYTPEEIKNITLHELVHIRNKHSVDVLLVELLTIVFWCSPLIYFYRSSLRNVHEYLADANVLQTTSRKQYAQLLLQQFQKGPGMAMANNFIHSQLKKRIKMMTRNQSTNTARWKYLLAVPVFLYLFFALAQTELLAQINQNENKEGVTENNEERIHPIIKRDLNDPIHKVVEEMPRFPGCEDIADKEARNKCAQQKMLEFIFDNIKYPKAAIDANTQGVVVIKFVIHKSGKITSPEVVRSIGNGCDEEALRVVKKMPNWIPGKLKGENVSVYFNLPIKYKLDEDNEKRASNKAPVKKDYGDEIFKVVEEMPRFPGCEDVSDKGEREKCAQQKMLEFVYNNVEYPKEAKEAGTEGMAVVKFIINEKGEVVAPEIIRSIGHGTDEAVLNMMEQMMAMEDKWIPGKQRGKVVKVQFNLPIRFKLDPKDKAAAQSNQKTSKSVANTLEVLSFSMSPNPVTDHLLISFEVADYKGLSLEVSDSNGRLIGEGQTSFAQAKNETTIDLSKISPGVLFVTLRNGDKVFTKQVVKR